MISAFLQKFYFHARAQLPLNLKSRVNLPQTCLQVSSAQRKQAQIKNIIHVYGRNNEISVTVRSRWSIREDFIRVCVFGHARLALRRAHRANHRGWTSWTHSTGSTTTAPLKRFFTKRKYIVSRPARASDLQGTSTWTWERVKPLTRATIEGRRILGNWLSHYVESALIRNFLNAPTFCFRFNYID